jgi:hypothetical protein
MEEIIVMNDDSAESIHAAEYAFNLACLYKKNIVVANLCRVSRPIAKNGLVRNNVSFDSEFEDEETAYDLMIHLSTLPPCTDHQPAIRRLDISGFAELDLVRYINSEKVWMALQGSDGDSLKNSRLNMQSVLNRVQCPFMLIPQNAPVRPLERLVYLADLRYAQVPVINFLSRMHTGAESVILAHICAQGLPDLEDSYALDLFSNGLNRNTSCAHLFFSYIREKDFVECIDQVINGIQADLLVCVNHHYHFEQLTAGNIRSPMPAYVNVPVLVFPH